MKAIEGVVCYIRDGNKTLLLDRNKDVNDINYGKFVGTGGHVEAGEKPKAATMREILEETGYEVQESDLHVCGIIYVNLPDSKGEMVRWKIYYYWTEKFKGEPKFEKTKGTFKWVEDSKLQDTEMREADKKILQNVVDKKRCRIRGYYNYKRDGSVVDRKIQTLVRQWDEQEKRFGIMPLKARIFDEYIKHNEYAINKGGQF